MIISIQVESQCDAYVENNSVTLTPNFSLAIETEDVEVNRDLLEDNNYQWRNDPQLTKEENAFMKRWVQENIEDLVQETLSGYERASHKEYQEDFYFDPPSDEKDNDESQNVERKEDYVQVCVWPGTTLDDDGPNEFVEFMKTHFDTRVQYLEEIKTLPNKLSDGSIDLETGGRNDIFFAVYKEDVAKFSVARLKAGIRWIEDVLSPVNYHQKIYPERVYGYKSWEE